MEGIVLDTELIEKSTNTEVIDYSTDWGLNKN